MIVLISPAKTLDFESDIPSLEATSTRFNQQSQELIDQLKHLSPEQISKLMSVSDKIAELNYERFHNWQEPDLDDTARPAIFAFKGDVYTGFEVETANQKTLDSSQKTVRILSGLYGLLRPLDRILPYRLEMGTKLATEHASNLYEFWGTRITDALNQDIADAKAPFVINLASNEYFKAVKPKAVSVPIITPVFKDTKNGKQKIISFYAKKARGLMARWICENTLESLEALKNFNVAGYRFDESQSTERSYVFTRDEIA